MKAYVLKNKLVNSVQMRRGETSIEYTNETRRPLEECLVLEIRGDAFLRDFFTILSEHVEKIRKAYAYKSVRGTEYVQSLKELDALVKKYAQKRAEIVKKLVDSGVEVEENYMGPNYILGNLGIGQQDYDRRSFPYAEYFNNIKLTKEMLMNPNDTTYKDIYEGEKAENVKRAQRIKELRRELRRNSITRSLSKEQVESIKSEIRNLKHLIKDEVYYKRDYDNYMSLTEEQKQEIIQYLEATEAIKKGVEAIKSLQRKLEQAKPSLSTPEVIDEALDRMEADGMSEEEVETLMKKLDEITRKRKEGHYETQYVKGNLDLEKAFLRDVYGYDEEKEREAKTQQKVTEESTRIQEQE